MSGTPFHIQGVEVLARYQVHPAPLSIQFLQDLKIGAMVLVVRDSSLTPCWRRQLSKTRAMGH